MFTTDDHYITTLFWGWCLDILKKDPKCEFFNELRIRTRTSETWTNFKQLKCKINLNNTANL